jgi:hypothetical protein
MASKGIDITEVVEAAKEVIEAASEAATEVVEGTSEVAEVTLMMLLLVVA